MDIFKLVISKLPFEDMVRCSTLSKTSFQIIKDMTRRTLKKLNVLTVSTSCCETLQLTYRNLVGDDLGDLSSKNLERQLDTSSTKELSRQQEYLRLKPRQQENAQPQGHHVFFYPFKFEPTPQMSERRQKGNLLSLLSGGRRSYSTWAAPQDDNQYKSFYEQVLRPELSRCYQRMSIGHLQSELIKVTKDDIVEVALRYPPVFQAHFFDQLVEKSIVVDDPNTSVYPRAWKTLLSRSVSAPLRHPLQVVSPTLPPDGWVLTYLDASPGSEKRGGGGGISMVHPSGAIDCWYVKIRNDSVLVSEGVVLWNAARHIASLEGDKKVERIVFVSDSEDLVSMLQGPGFIRNAYPNLFRCLVAELSRFKKWRIIYQPREGLALADKIANITSGSKKRETVEWNIVKPFEFVPEQVEARKLLAKLESRIPVLRVEVLKKGLSEAEIMKNQRFTPYKKEKEYSDDKKIWTPFSDKKTGVKKTGVKKMGVKKTGRHF